MTPATKRLARGGLLCCSTIFLEAKCEVACPDVFCFQENDVIASANDMWNANVITSLAGINTDAHMFPEQIISV